MDLKLAQKKNIPAIHRQLRSKLCLAFNWLIVWGSHYQLLTVGKFFQVSGSWEKREGQVVYRSPEISFQLVFKPKLKLVPLSKQSVLKSQPWTENSIEAPDISIIMATYVHTHTYVPNTRIHYNVHVYRALRQGISWYGCFLETYGQREIFESGRQYFRSGQGLFERSCTNTSNLNRPCKWNYTQANQLDTSGMNKPCQWAGKVFCQHLWPTPSAVRQGSLRRKS